jgi:hypothetical protein
MELFVAMRDIAFNALPSSLLANGTDQAKLVIVEFTPELRKFLVLFFEPNLLHPVNTNDMNPVV